MASMVYVIGLRGCKGTAIGFGRLLSFMMPNVTAIIDSECTSISLIQDLEEGDVVLMFVFSRFYKIDLEYLKHQFTTFINNCPFSE